MSDEIEKAAADAALYGLGIMKDGKAIPIEEALAAPPAAAGEYAELIKRLRLPWPPYPTDEMRIEGWMIDLLGEAADALAAAQARIAALTEALREIEMLHYGDGSLVDDHKAAHKIARAALKGGENDA